MHSFPAKCPPQLARWAIVEHSNVGDLVVDPFCGSGTTLVEAKLAKRPSIGIEIDPIACLMTRVKTTPLDVAHLDASFDNVVERARGLIDDPTFEYPQPEIDNFDYWFLPSVARELAALTTAVLEAKLDTPTTEFLLLAISTLIVAKNSVANARDVAHSRHHYRKHDNVPDVVATFAMRYRRMRGMMARFASEVDSCISTTVIETDARDLPLDDGLASLIVTSPPYCNAIDYTRTHRFSIGWIGDALGISFDEYRLLGKEYVGSERGGSKASNNHEGRVSVESQKLSQIAGLIREQSPKSAAIVREYFEDMATVLAECHRILSSEGKLVVIISPSRIRRIEVPNHDIIAEIAVGLPDSFELIASYERRIASNRRVMPYLMEQFGPRMNTEHVLVLQKPG